MENVEVAPVTSIVDKTADQLFEVSPAYSDDQIVEITSDDETPEILKPVEFDDIVSNHCFLLLGF